MAKFGRFKLGFSQPTETYEGDSMQLDEKGFVRIFRNEPMKVLGVDTIEPNLVHAIHLDKGERVSKLD